MTDEVDDWDASGDKWAEAEVDNGDKITWEQEPTFLGTYRGDKELTNALGEPFTAHQLVSKDGELRLAWNSPELTTGLHNAGAGAKVSILWLGLEQGRRKGTTQNKFIVRFQRPIETQPEKT